MRSRIVEVLPPFGDGASGVVEAEEQALVQELVAHSAVEALDIAILHRPSCSRRTPMIWSSVTRFRFISPSFDQGSDSNLRWRKN